MFNFSYYYFMLNALIKQYLFSIKYFIVSFSYSNPSDYWKPQVDEFVWIFRDWIVT